MTLLASAAMSTTAASPPTHSAKTFATAVASIGVVFGDIGTSPLYTLQVAVDPKAGLARDDVFGIVSLIVWALILAVSLKYVTFVMRADNRGEGGILALLGLLPQPKGVRIGGTAVPVVAGAAGAEDRGGRRVRHERRRGALRRHGALRSAPHPQVLVRPRAARARALVPRARVAHRARPARAREPLLRHGPRRGRHVRPRG